MEPRQLKIVREIEYLLGYDQPGFGNFEADTGGGDRLPLLSSPLSNHIKKVNRFLFAGGLSAIAINHDSEDPANIFLTNQISEIKLNAWLDMILERGMVTGEVLLTFNQQLDKSTGLVSPYYQIHLYDALEFKRVETEITGRPEDAIQISYIVVKEDGKEYLYKMLITRSAYIEFPLIPLAQAASFEWIVENATVSQHDYGFMPAVVIQNKMVSDGGTGLSEFNRAAIETATEIAKLDVDLASNHHFFGSPLFVSPDPKQTYKDLRSRKQILEKLPNEDGGSPEVLEFQPVPSTAMPYIERLERSLSRMLGTDDYSKDIGADVSSLTLRLLNGNSISVAEEKALLYVGGLQVFLGKMLRSAAIDGVIADVSASDPESYKIELKRSKPYFEVTAAERSSNLANAQALIDLGIRREVALRLEYFPELSEAEILEMMEADVSSQPASRNLFE